MFLQMAEKKDTNSLSKKQKKIGIQFLYFSNQLLVQVFSGIIHIQARLHNQTNYWKLETNFS